MLKHIGIYLLFAFGLISCNIKEDISDCPGTILLDYTAYSDEILDEIEPDEQVHVYIFDHNDICFKVYQFSYAELEAIDFEFKVPILYNGQNAVVWHGNDAADYKDDNMAIGHSLEEFMLTLNHDLQNKTINHLPSSLWASPLEPIEYCASKSRHRIHMTRIHTRINVNLRQEMPDGSVKEVDMDDYLLTVKSTNNVYHTDYTLCDSCEELTFTNREELDSNSFLDWGHVGTLRVSPDMSCTMQIAPADFPDDPIKVAGSTEFDLTQYMLDSRGKSVDPEMSDQRYLDLNKIWNVDFTLNPAGVAVKLIINGWTIWLDDVDLE